MPDTDPPQKPEPKPVQPKRSLAEIIAGVQKTDTLPPGPTGGRPSARSPQRVNDILAALKIGATRKDAAEFNGIVYDTLRRWIQKGEQELASAVEEDRDPEGDFFGFFVAVRQAEAECAIRMTRTVTAAGDKDWRPAIEFLKRRRPEWRDSLDVTKLTTEQLLALYADSGED